MGAGIQKSSHSDNFIGADRGGSHSLRYFPGEAYPSALHSKTSLQDGLFSREWVEQRVSNHPFCLSECACGQCVAIPVEQHHVLGGKRCAAGQVCCRRHNLDCLALLLIRAHAPIEEKCDAACQDG